MNGKKKLVLFDIDGTLITTNGLGRTHFAAAIQALFPKLTAARSHDFAGKLDTQIYREILSHARVDDALIEEHFDAFVSGYVARLDANVTAKDITVLPGVKNLLEALSEDSDITTALLTGNLEPGARIKLSAAGLYRYFLFGAFGTDGKLREDLPAVAVRRAEELTGVRFSGKDIVVIGDTPNDIHCGETLGVKTLAVATGTFNYETLASHHPDYLFRTLDDTQRVLAAIYA